MNTYKEEMTGFRMNNSPQMIMNKNKTTSQNVTRKSRNDVKR